MRLIDIINGQWAITAEMLDEIRGEAERQQRSISWIMQQAWRIAYPTIRLIPDVPSTPPTET